MAIVSIIMTDNEHDYTHAAVHRIMTSITEATHTHDDVRIGLTGGRSTKPIYRDLLHAHADWAKIHAFILDERNVPVTDKENNLSSIRAELLEDIKIAHDHVHAFHTELGYESATRAYEQDLMHFKAARSAGKPLFDLIILGVGPDGHIASIFPDTQPAKKGFLTMQTTTEQSAVKERMTVTEEALNSSAHALVLFYGHEKAHAFHEMRRELRENTPTLPVSRIVARIPSTIVTMDITEA